ncbi:MAG TPA: DUF4178 domain-containing protein [Longimicrobiales bacterium]
MAGSLSAAERRVLDAQFAAIRQLDVGRLIAPAERWRHTIKDLGPGAYFRLDNRTYRVEESNSYRETSEDHTRVYEDEAWTELRIFCLESGETRYLEWEEDDAVEASITVRALEFRDVRDDAGAAVDEDDLDTIVEEEDSLFLDGREFVYDDDYAAVFERAGKSEFAYFYDFVSADGDWLTIEEWTDPAQPGREEYTLWLSRSVAPDAIEVLVPAEG